MADLDDFFAKKDRKKSKSTKKFSTTDEVAKKLEDNAKKSEKQKKERVNEGDETNAPIHDQDEWKDFEEEKKDYSGLKIGNLTITSQTGGDGNQGSAENNQDQQNSDDPTGQDGDKKVGPWKRVDNADNPQQQDQHQQQQHHQQEDEVAAAPPVKVEKKVETQASGAADKPQRTAYVPPSMRNMSSSQPHHHHQQRDHHNHHNLQPSRLRSKAAPDIHNEEFFPTLMKTNEYKKNRSEGAFEVVQHSRAGSHRQVEQAKMSSAGQGPKLSLENRYNTLSDS